MAVKFGPAGNSESFAKMGYKGSLQVKSDIFCVAISCLKASLNLH